MSDSKGSSQSKILEDFDMPKMAKLEPESKFGDGDKVALLFIVMFLCTFFGLRYYKSVAENDVRENRKKAALAKKMAEEKKAKEEQDEEYDEEYGEEEYEDDDDDDDDDDYEEEGEEAVEVKWVHYTDEIEIKGDKIVCQHPESKALEVLDLKACLGKVTIKDEYQNTEQWLEFPGKKRILWKDKKLAEALEKNAPKELLYKLDYAKYSGNVEQKENK